MKPEQSSVRVSGCPAWCVIDHEELTNDELDDVVHESAHLPVAGIVPQGTHDAEDAPVRRAATAELYLVRYQYAGEADEWLYLGDGHSGLDISPETAQRLRRAIGQLVNDEAERR